MLNTVVKAMTAAGITSSTADVEGQVQTKFMEHVANYGISYGTQEEYDFRMQIFSAKDADYAAINADPLNTFTVGHNMFSTMTRDEAKRMTGLLPSTEELEFQEFDDANFKQVSIDWRQRGAVNSIQNQGQCGSCWAFAATAAMEGAHAIKSGRLLKGSESQLVDCVQNSNGCNGGRAEAAFQYAQQTAQELESSYPYVAQTRRCQARGRGAIQARSHNNVQRNNARAMMSAIGQGPVAVAVDADNNYFHGYTGGIMNNCGNSSSLDHAITAVGYGNERGQDYAIVRNSWGTSWGESGYIRMALGIQRGQGACGVLMQGSTVQTY